MPNGISEYRSFDALNRLQSFSTSAPAAFSLGYQYDAVGNLRQMSDFVLNLHTIPSYATWNWTYDDRYRLLSETVDDASSFVRRTEFDWDSADNRTAMRKYAGGSLASTTVYDPASTLNQMMGWTCGSTNAVYLFDANGNRTNKTVTTTEYTEYTETTAYGYDEDNRLVSVAVTDAGETNNYSFAYDYRTRRYSRETPTEKTLHVFDGGLSVQEYDVSQASSLPSVSTLTTESIRGKGMGGGVGGMVYSIRNGQIKCSHSNHRGDIIARTDSNGSLTWFARYNAYGTRFDEVGATYDLQRGNTKDEETPLGLSNQGMRWLDLYHGVWLTLDPIGFADGPNRYAYVGNNPITSFDAKGLKRADYSIGTLIGKMGARIISELSSLLSIPGRIDDAVMEANGGYGMDALEMDLIANGIPGDEMVGAAGVVIVRGSKIIRKADNVLDSVDVVSDTSRGLKKAATKGDEAAVVATKLNKAETPSSVATSAPDAKTDAIKDMRAEGIDVSPDTGEFRGGEGTVYKVPGSGTESGKPYVGTADDMGKRTRTAKDGRDRTQAEEIGKYPTNDNAARRRAEQDAIDENGGVENLDNKRNEIAEDTTGEADG